MYMVYDIYVFFDFFSLEKPKGKKRKKYDDSVASAFFPLPLGGNFFFLQ